MDKASNAFKPVSSSSNLTYEEFFGLRCSPFHLSPDPFFVIPSEKLDEALLSISRAVQQRKGFVVMTGEVGTGKTLVLRCLAELWQRQGIPFAYFIGARLSTVDFFKYITGELRINVAEPTKGNLLRALYEFLQAQFENGLTTVLIIDEAHQVPRGVLEEIRLLTNFESSQEKLVQIVLVGQPELEKKLELVELRALKQRIAVRCELAPLREDEIQHYIEHRLELAGAGPQAASIFPASTVRTVYRYSRGIPRVVNSICDYALTAAHAEQVRVVPAGMIKEAASYFRLAHVPNLQPIEQPSISSEIRPPRVPQAPVRAVQAKRRGWTVTKIAVSTGLRFALILGIATVMPGAVSTEVSMASRQQEAVTLPDQALSTAETPPVGQTTESTPEPWEQKLKTDAGKSDIAGELDSVSEGEQRTATAVPLTLSMPPALPHDAGRGSPDVPVKISFTSDPDGAEIEIDDSFVGKTPTTWELKPGKHTIQMFMNGYRNWVQSITVEEGSDVQVAATLTRSTVSMESTR
ncbi:MAG: AAA family ATPase [Candidatus Acidiferrales bacterium]